MLRTGRRFPPFDQNRDEEQLYGFGEMLLHLAANEMTLHQYLDVPITLFPHQEGTGDKAGQLPFSVCREMGEEAAAAQATSPDTSSRSIPE